MKRRLFFDASYTLRNPVASGVHRVVSRCWEAIAAQVRDTDCDLELTRVVHCGERFVAAKTLGSEPTDGRCGESTPRPSRLRTSPRQPFVTFRRGDVLLLPDAYWACPAVWKAVQHARAQGATVTTLIYDLIPLHHTAIYGVEGAASVRRYVEKVIRHSDQIVTISRTVAHDVQEFASTLPPPLDQPRITSWRLGCDLPNPDGPVRGTVQHLFQARSPYSPYLVVGSFDQRKNHAFVLRCFEQLWSRDGTKHLRLAFAGTPSLSVEPIVAAVRQHPLREHSLFLLPGLSDAELAHAYRNARGVIVASIAEGFCLPIVEAQHYGQNVFVSDIPIHREVGGGSCTFFGLQSSGDLEAAIERFESTHHAAVAPPQPPVHLHTWDEAATRLVDLVMGGSGSRRSPPTLALQASATARPAPGRHKALYFTGVPLAVDSNGGSLCCREHVAQLAADKSIDLEVLAVGEQHFAKGTLDFLASLGVKGSFCSIHSAAPAPHIPWLTRIWPYVNERTASLNRHVAMHVAERIRVGQPDVCFVDYTPSAAFVRRMYRGKIPVVTIRLTREVDFHRELLRHGIPLDGGAATRIGALRAARFESWVHHHSAAVVAIGRYDVPPQHGTGPLTFWFPPLPTGVGPGWKYGGRKELGFIGNIGHFPNKDATEWLAKRFSPALMALDPDARIVIIGAEASQVPADWCAPNIDYRGIAGRAEVEAMLGSAAFLMAPIRLTDGAKFKVFEAMQRGTPLLATEAAMSGVACLPWLPRIDLGAPEQAAHLAVAGMNDPTSLAATSDRILGSARFHIEMQTGRWGAVIREVLALAAHRRSGSARHTTDSSDSHSGGLTSDVTAACLF